MRERPILFSAPMVRALLAGVKTQTRRLVKPQFAAAAIVSEVCATTPEGWQTSGHSGRWWDDAEADAALSVVCPYGIPGDRLWVREAFAFDSRYDGLSPAACYPMTGGRWFMADGTPTVRGTLVPGKGRPGIHMPRWACRIELEVEAVRVERLHAITEADARAEGAIAGPLCPMGFSPPGLHPDELEDANMRARFAALWSSINGPESWAANPWVWCVAFRRVEP